MSCTPQKCECDSPVGCKYIDPTAQAPSDDRTTYWNVTTLTAQWQKFYFPVEVVVKPTTYAGGSDNNYTGIQVVSGQQLSVAAGSDTPWEVVSAGKAVKLPCGMFWLRSNSSVNIVNVRIYPAAVQEVKGISRAYFRPPTTFPVTAASSNALAALVGRAFLYLENMSANHISIAFGPAPAVLDSGITLFPGDAITLTDEDCPEDAMQAIAGANPSNLAIQEG